MSGAVERHVAAGPARAAAEAALVAAGVPLVFSVRNAVTALPGAEPSTLLVCRGADGVPVAGAGVAARRVGGLAVLRAAHVAVPTDAASATALATALAAELRADARAVRLDVELFDRDPDRRRPMAAALAAAGFVPTDVNGYVRTIAVDLRPDTETILGAFDRSARRNVRALEKLPVVLRRIDDEALIPRLEALYRETFARTGGHVVMPDFRLPIAATRAAPALSHFVGLFRADDPSPEALLAFAWGQHHGDRAEYSHGASTRQTEIRIPLVYPLLWELMTWSKSAGAVWFDMGGVTLGSGGSPDDPLGGISDFKRFFSRDMVEVAEEWRLDGRSLPARLARLAQRVLRR